MYTLRRIIQVIGVVAMLGVPATVAAQDTHYWTEQFGTRSELLGGVVVGSILDLSTTFYNPGALALTESKEVLLSAKAFEYRKLTVRDGAGEGEDLSSTRFSPAPSIFTGLIPSKWLTGQLAYSFVTRQDLNMRIKGRRGDKRDVLSVTPGDESFAGEVLFEQNLSEVWGGVTWSHSPTSNVGIGFTSYVAYHGQRTRSQTIAQAVTSTNKGAATINVDEFDYYHYRMLAKLGIALDYDPLKLGLTLTTPSVGLFGSGSALINRSVIGLDLDGNGSEDSQLTANFQEGLDPDFKSPLSVAAGASYRLDRIVFHLTAEWFNAVDKFVVLDTDDFQSQSTGKTVSYPVTHELDDVLNWGIGVEHVLRENFSYYGSFVADYSAQVTGTDTNHSFSNWDIYHVTGGAAVNISGLEFTLGLGYAFGKEDLLQPVNFTNADEDNQLVGDPSNTEINYSRWKFIVGFSFSI